LGGCLHLGEEGSKGIFFRERTRMLGRVCLQYKELEQGAIEHIVGIQQALEYQRRHDVPFDREEEGNGQSNAYLLYQFPQLRDIIVFHSGS